MTTLPTTKEIFKAQPLEKMNSYVKHMQSDNYTKEEKKEIYGMIFLMEDIYEEMS